MAAIILDNGNFEEEVLKSSQPVLVDFWATWCGPCQKQGPIVEEIADSRSDIKVCKLDVDEVPEIAERYSIMSIPTVIAFKNGQPVNKSIGLASKDQLLALFN